MRFTERGPIRPTHHITGTLPDMLPDRASGGDRVFSLAEFYGVSPTGVGTRLISTSTAITGSIGRTSRTVDGSTMLPIERVCRTLTDASTISFADRIKETSRQVARSSGVEQKRAGR